jgi:hypothetical protein
MSVEIVQDEKESLKSEVVLSLLSQFSEFKEGKVETGPT